MKNDLDIFYLCNKSADRSSPLPPYISFGPPIRFGSGTEQEIDLTK